MPQIVRENIDSVNVVLTLTVPKEEYEKQFKSELARVQNKASIKGYRIGKVPADVVKRMYGQEILAKMIDDTVNKEFDEYLNKETLDIIGQPMLSDETPKNSYSVNNLQDFVFKFEVALSPKFDLQGLDGNTEMPYFVVRPDDSVVAEELLKARQRVAEQVSVDTDIEEKDVLQLEAKELDGEGGALKSNGWKTTFTVSVEFVTEEFRAEVLGKKKGDLVRFNIFEVEKGFAPDKVRQYLLNADKNDPTEIGNYFEATIADVTRAGAAELNQEFYDKYFGEGVVSSELEAENFIRNNISRYFSSQADALLYRDLQDKMLEIHNFELPAKTLKKWLHISQKIPMDKVEEDYPLFEKDLRWNIISNKIAQNYGIKVTEDDLRNGFEDQILSMLGGNAAQFSREMLGKFADNMMKNEKAVNELFKQLQTEQIFNAMKKNIFLLEQPIAEGDFKVMFEQVMGRSKAEME